MNIDQNKKMMMRSWINLFEGRVLQVPIKRKTREFDLKVVRNPLPIQIDTLFDSEPMRGIIDHAGDLYVWSAIEALHDEVESAVGISGRFFFTTDGSEGQRIESLYSDSSDYDNPEWLNNPNVLKAWGGRPTMEEYVAARYST